MNTHPQGIPDSVLFAIFVKVATEAPSQAPNTQNDLEEQRLGDEIKQLAANPGELRKAVAILFPDGVLVDLSFYDRLVKLIEHLNWGESANQTVGLIWATAVRSVEPKSGEQLLMLFPTMPGPSFFALLDSLSFFFPNMAPDAEFMAGWLSAIVKRIGRDLGGGAFWNSLGTYCETQIESALKILDQFTKVNDESAISITAYILGALRSLLLSDPNRKLFCCLDTEFAQSPTRAGRSVYFRSWIQTASRGKISRENLDAIVERATFVPAEEQEDIFFLFSRLAFVPTLPPDLFKLVMDWLARNTSPSISATAKHQIVEAAALLAATDRHDAGYLIISMQPIPNENKGSWAQVEHYFLSRLNKDLESFVTFCIELAGRNAKGWLKAMQEPRGFESVLTQMRGKDIGLLVSRLVFSRDSACRRLGLFIFDDLDLESFPVSELTGIGETELRLCFYEAQRNLIHGKAVARFLIALIPRIEKTSKQVQDEFSDELVLQAKNYGGECRTEFEKKAEQIPLLKSAVEEVKKYYDALGLTQKSSIGQMDVPGYSQAYRIHRRRFSNEVTKGAESASVLMSFFKRVQLLYGTHWSSYHGGTLSQTSGLQTISSSFEIPRLEIIDPEGMALHRLERSMLIASLAEITDQTEGE